MHQVLITGAGKIGTLIACLLADSGDYEVYIADRDFSGSDVKRFLDKNSHIHTVTLNVSDEASVGDFLENQSVDAIISSLPYYVNEPVAKAAKAHNVHYFDLTEDTNVTAVVKAIAEGAQSAFVPQCGLAPGFISIVANSLMQHFDELDTVKLRVGALPQHSSNALQYALTWSTEGVINEYGNPCYGVQNGRTVTLHPLEGLEAIQIDGLSYEAFNTSGGLGSLDEIYAGKVKNMDYKTIRYPGHCEKMRVLMNDLKLNEDRDTLKHILERAVPKTYQDVVLVYVSVTGRQQGSFVEENYLKKVYPQIIAGLNWSAIQVTTASGVCAVVDMLLGQADQYKGLVLQETFSLDAFLQNRFGRYYA